MVNEPRPMRDAVNAAANTAVLVFFGSLVIGVFNRTLYNALNASKENPRPADLHAVTD